MKVFVLTYCKSPDSLYGNLLIFKTLRTGFPNSNIVIVDNGSISKAKDEISRECKKNDCEFISIDHSVPYWEFYQDVIVSEKEDLIFLDPDTCFWDNCENIDIGDKLFGGRLIPQHYDEYSGCVAMPRIHTSFMIIKNRERLLKLVMDIKKTRFHFDPIRPYMTKVYGSWIRYDTSSNLYSVLQDHSYRFMENELEKYDHLFCGTHFNLIFNGLSKETKKEFFLHHDHAKKDFTKLKGIWKFQSRYFNRGGNDRINN